MEILRTFDLLENLKSFAPTEDILARKSKGEWIKYSIDDYIDYSNAIACGLLALGYKAGAKIITITANRPEWNFSDMGINLAHMVHIPIYGTLGRDEYKFIFENSDAELVIVDSASMYKRISQIISEMESSIKMIMIDDSEEIFCFSKLYALGREHAEEFGPVVEDNRKNISPDELASIVYTSGTTGTPKGVMLSHRNLTFDSHGHAVRQTVKAGQKMLSFLPLCHTYERTMNYEYQELGICIYYAESLATIASDIASCKADGFCAVPRVLEMMYGKLESAGDKLKGFKKKIYKLAWNYANNFDTYNHLWPYIWQRAIYDKLVYSKWRANFSGKEMLIVSGGSSIQARIIRTFAAAKLYIFEGYGMTEASPVIAVNSPADKVNIVGTVGLPMGGTEISFAPDGEILTRGPHVMMGYYKNPEATAEVIDEDGWLHTGDIGMLQDGKYLKITDRKKEIFKLSAGKYIAPQSIETLLKESPFIDNSIVIGENQKFASAIITINKLKVKEFAINNKIEFNDDHELVSNDEVLKMIHSEVEAINKKLSAYEVIKRERVIDDSWTIDNGMLSQTLKLKRRNIHKKYASTISEIYKADSI